MARRETSQFELAGAPWPRAAGRLTVAVVTHEDASLLPATLDSVRPVADELLLVETGQANRTWQFASRYGARVAPCGWTDDASAARNFAIQEATGDWMLWVEPGEPLEASAGGSLRQYLAQTCDRPLARTLFIEVASSTPGGRAEQQAQVRLMPRFTGLEFVGRICETARPALAAAGVAVDVSPWRILRSSLVDAVERRRRRVQRDLKLLHRELEEHGPRAQLLLALGEIETSIGQAPQAAVSFRRAISLAPRGSREMLEGYYGLLTTFDTSQPSGRQAQLAACLEALEIYPFDAQLLCAAGGYLQQLGQADLARRSFETAVRYGQVNPETWHLVGMAEFTASLLALHLQTEGQDQASAEVLAEAVARLPESEYLRNIYLENLVKLGRTADALAVLDSHTVPPTERDALRSAIRGAAQAARQNWIPAIAYLETAYSAGCRHPVCLRWYTVALLSTGAVETAAPVLDDWLRVLPHDTEALRYREVLDSLATTAPAAAAVRPVETEAAAPTGAEADLRTLRIDAARDPASIQAHLRLGKAYRSAGDSEAALAVLRDFAQRHPARADATRALCELLIECGHVAEAIERAGQSTGLVADGAFQAFLLGVAAGERQSWSDAVGHFEAAYRQGYRHPLLLPQWSICLVQLGRFPEAEALLRQLAAPAAPHFSRTAGASDRAQVAS